MNDDLEEHPSVKLIHKNGMVYNWSIPCVLVHFARRIRINNSNIPGNDASRVWDVSGFIDKVEFE
jgi:hypothetical protein